MLQGLCPKPGDASASFNRDMYSVSGASESREADADEDSEDEYFD